MNDAGPLPFELGETSKGTDTDGNIITPDWAGKIFNLAASNMSASKLAPRRSGRPLLGVPLLNNSGITLLGKRLARLKRAGGVDDLSRVDGYSAVLAEKGVVIIDEFLATGGVADKYYFWGIFEGPAIVLTPTADADFNGDIAVGALLVAATGATTGNSTSGRVANFSITNATAGGTTVGLDAYNSAVNLVGRALSARTTGGTALDLLIHAMLRY